MTEKKLAQGLALMKQLGRLILAIAMVVVGVGVILTKHLVAVLKRDPKKRKLALALGALLLLVAVCRARNAATAQATASDSASAASRQADAYKAYQDYQYVKYMGPISGPMYRSTEW